jgi:hypothetical protein
MKCPKCGYNSFDHLDSCKKCGQGLTEHKEKFNLHGFFFPGKPAKTEAEPVVHESDELEEPPDDGTIDFGFDFLDEEEDQSGKTTGGISLGDDNQAVNIIQPFAADSETIPVDDRDTSDKPGKGPEFVF